MSIKAVPTFLGQWLRRVAQGFHAPLATYYQLCHRTGFALGEATCVRSVSLGDEELVWLRRDSGVTQIEVRAGVVWLTGSPAKGDVLLREGEQLRLERDWECLVQALGPARIVLRS